MYEFSTELGIRLSFVKTSEFRGEGGLNPQPPWYATAVVMYLPVRWDMITKDGFVRVWKEFAGVDISAGPVQSFVQ
jgi:hypothetical protein